jgi:hypothetical protein
MEYHTFKAVTRSVSIPKMSVTEHHERGFTVYARKQPSANHVPAGTATTAITAVLARRADGTVAA